MKKIISIVLTCVVCLFCISCGEETLGVSTFDKESMTITYETNLRIVQVADIQGDTVEEIQSTFDDYLDKTIEMLQPNLIVLTGDNIDAEWNETSDPEGSFSCLLTNMEKFKIPWAPIFGNHDAENESGVTKTYMADAFEAAEYCLFERGDFVEDNSVGNYVVRLKKKDTLKYNLIFFDSNMYTSVGIDAIHTNQVEWYENVVETTKVDGKVIPSMLFYHIPIPEYVWAIRQYGKDSDRPLELPDGKGFIGEGVSHPAVRNTGLFDSILKLGSTKAMFCGHDHGNYCDIEYQGVRFNYGLKSSVHSYMNYPENIGVKQITITKKDKIDIKHIFYKDI